MQKQTLAITSLHIRRMPGFRNGMQPLGPFSPRITLVYGPNASGKSTTALAIQSLFWPSLDTNDEISAEFTLAEQHWSAEVVGQHITAHADGKPQTLPIHESPESSRRYMLALHDLIKDSDAHLADAVRKEAAGGYDLPAAVQTLKYRENYTRANANDVAAFREAKQKARQITNEQKDLQLQYNRLDELEDKHAKAKLDIERKRLFEHVLELNRHEQELQQAIDRRATFAEGIERVHTGDLKLFRSLNEELGQAELDLQGARTQAQQTLQNRQALMLPGSDGVDGVGIQGERQGNDSEIDRDGGDKVGVDGAGVSDFDLELLDKLGSTWKEYERQAADLDRTINSKHKVLEECEARLAPEIDKEQFAALQAESRERLEQMQSAQIGELAPLLQRAIRTSSRLNTLEEQINTLDDHGQQVHAAGSKDQDEQIDPVQLSRAIGQLSRWLGESATSNPITPAWYLATALAGIVTALAVYWAGIWGFGALALLAFVLWYGWRQTHRNADESGTAASASTRQEELDRLGIAGPKHWSRNEVLSRLDSLSLALARAHKHQELTKERKKLEDERRKLTLQLQKEHEQVRRAGRQLGFDIKSWTANGQDEHEVAYWVLTHLLRWHEANSELQGLQVQQSTLNQQIAETSQRVNQVVQRYGRAIVMGDTTLTAGSTAQDDDATQHDRPATEPHATPITNSEQAQAVWSVLRDKAEQWNRLTDAYNTQTSRILELETRITRTNKQLSELLERLQISRDEEYRLVEWTRDLEAYADACTNEKTLTRTIDRLQNEIKAHPLFEQTCADGPLFDMSRTEIEATIEQLQSAEDTLQDLTEQIIRIKQQADSVREEHKLEQALGELDQKRQALYRLYEQNLAKLTGDALAGILSREIYTQGSTPVQKKASELFTRITRGRYRIELSAQDDQGFLAWDTVENRSKSLNALSSGTRIQLLLAVRLAFIEQYEAGVALPLLADELLANSDDERAGEIVDALVAIAATGRQVIYFTAQLDEISKWMSRLEAAGLSEADYALLPLSGDSTAASFVPPDASDNPRPAFADELPELHVNVPPPEQAPPLATGPNNARTSYLNTLADHNLIPAFNAVLEPIERLPVVHVLDSPDTLYRVLRLGIFRLGMLTNWLEASPGQAQSDVSGGSARSQPLLSPDERRSVKRWSLFFEHYLALRRQGHDRPIDREVLDASGAVSAAFSDRVNEALAAVEFIPSRLIEALRSGEVQRFQSARTDQLEAYLQDNGYIARDAVLTNDELAARLRNLILQLGLNADEAQRRLRALDGAV